MKTGSKTVLIEIAGVEGEVTAEFDYYPGRAMSMYGGPDHVGWPEEPPELDLTALWAGEGKGKVNMFSALTAEQVVEIEDSILEEGPEEDY